MTGFIAAVDARTQLAGQNRMELLLFRLRGEQRFGINVFKVREVIQCPRLTTVPESNHIVCGVANIRGKTISVIDLGVAIGMPPIEDTATAFLVITEYNRNIQGFLVSSVDSIVNHNWEQILSPPEGSVAKGYLVAVTHVDEELVGILDVERVLAELRGFDTTMSEEDIAANTMVNEERNLVLIADDSVVARTQVSKTIEQLGGEVVVTCDGLEAWDLLNKWVETESSEFQRLSLIVSDIEMPRMDGYTLCTRIRDHAGLRHFPVVLHTSMSGGFNESMVEKVGADDFVSKFDPKDLGESISTHMNKKHDSSASNEAALAHAS
ncbi:MAG: chemotaxis protein [Pseudomonadota bacterium]